MSVRRETRRDPRTGAERHFWIVDVVFEHPSGRLERVRKVSPVPTRRGAQEFERQVRASLLSPAAPPRDVPTLGSFVAKIERLERFIATLTRDKELSAKRAKNVLATLRRILVSAVEREVLPALPRFPKVKVTQGHSDFFNREESDKLLAATRDPEERALLMFALHTGARAGEQIAFEWQDLDLHNQLVVFRRSSSDGIVGPTKSGKERKVPLTASLHAALTWLRHLKGRRVFCKPDGAPLKLDYLHERLWGACRRSGLRRIRWHDCRHSFASQLVIAGTPLRQVQEWLGHSTILMTMRYSHLAPGGGREYLVALDGPRETSGPRQSYGNLTATEGGQFRNVAE